MVSLPWRIESGWEYPEQLDKENKNKPPPTGPKSAHKLTADILAFIEEKIEEDKPLRARKLAPLIKEQFGKDVHPRSIERAVARRKKKRK